MNVEFISRRKFIESMYIGKVNCKDTAYISISCTPEEVYEIHEHLVKCYPLLGTDIISDDILTLNFYDDENSMTEGDARKIVDFINKHTDKNIVVHCLLGVSRSGAVAKFINDYFGLDIEYLNQYSNYNRQVYNKLNAVVGKDLASYYAELEKSDRPTFSG